MSVSTMFAEFKKDMAENPKAPVREFNGYVYTYPRPDRVAISDPRGRFVSYERLKTKALG